MAQKRLGGQTVMISRVGVKAFAATVGQKEKDGPLGKHFTHVLPDDTLGEKTWEKAESRMLQETVQRCIENGNVKSQQVEYLFGGDLLNQIIAASFAARTLQIPFFGLYGACSTMAESLSLGAMLIDGNYADHVVCVTSSHFCTAERQYRAPLESGTQRTPTAQWTVTGSGATMLCSSGGGAHITHITTGKVLDLGVLDANNMGAAMAPAAADTLLAHFRDTGRTHLDYDLIVTGDLGMVGKDLFLQLMQEKDFPIPPEKAFDCGVEIFAPDRQDTHAGGSGCGCSASVLNGYLMKDLFSGKVTRIVFMATGALLSPTSSMQGESIPSIAHAVVLEHGGVQ